MKKLWNSYIHASLIKKITVALVIGIILGLLLGDKASALAPFGDLMLRLLQFIIIPLILFTLIVGVNQTNIGNLGRMGGKVFLYYLGTSALAIIIGTSVASLFDPGTGLSLSGDESFEVPEDPGVTQVLLSIVPDNIVKAFVEMNLLGIIFTAFAFGIAISYMRSTEKFGEKADRLYDLIDTLNELTLTVMKGILQYIPIGIAAIIAGIVGDQGADTLQELGGFIGVLYIALLVQLIIYAGILLLTKTKLSRFFGEARTPMVTAFVTQSSSGTLPVTLHAASQLKLNKSLYGFSLPLGATINMDGAAIRIAVSAVFAANVIGDPLSFVSVLQVVIVGTLASVGTAGVPGAGIIMIATVFSQVGLPMEAVALLTAVDVFVGMGATALNVTGDLVGTNVISKTEKQAS
ncbi:dicarboxylate/amino acid:cation symporter [Salimicrobium jeotgali]|uniref:Dicarboxylate/amino acid:cation symporter n=2 Tax=Salimicrobium TaxID=351195 RepID=K2FM81_9BACI|nr:MULTISPECIES: dicarboxylate/amino acid:cation symporter [Salimicrobium]AKG03551.1 dicarboxylate/amino acid:cation symporter [Salimicrobium jeotgali]EKE32041.1 sodium/dicarboxylate symporter family protein [Salimicrobium jeotgali]MBM7696008.1 Na+/H+-dicarboxylate symporter [Salimicrobium jeotgali]SIS87832.1 Na+/H+-dicarboxylate symporter [Salimicrobium salexigens]